MPPRPSFHNPTVIFVLKALGTCLCVALGLLASARPAGAGFNATLNSVSRDSNNNYVTLAVQNTDSNNAFNFSNVIAGRLNWTASSSVPGLTGSGNTFGTFCIEIPQHVSLNSAYDFTQRLYGKSGFHKMTVPSHFGGIHAGSEFAPQSIQ